MGDPGAIGTGGAIVLERLWFIFRASTDPPSLELALGDLIYHGKKKMPPALSGEATAPSQAFQVAVDHREVDPEAMAILLEQRSGEIFPLGEGLRDSGHHCQGYALLGSGTVIGMIDAFEPSGDDGSSMAVMAGDMEGPSDDFVAGLSMAVR